jgi:hypothetical protein
MSKSVLFSCFVASALLFSSCNNSGGQSSDLELVSKNIDVAIQTNQEASAKLSFEIKAYLLENTDISVEKKDKFQKTLDKISALEKEEKTVIDIIDAQKENIELDKIISSSEDFLKSINSNIEENQESEGVLNNIKSELDFSKYKLDGSESEKSLGLNSIKLSVSHAYFLSINHLRSLISLN